MFEYHATAINVVDGDTLDVVVTLSEDYQVLATVTAPDFADGAVRLLSDVTSDYGFRITEQRIVTLEPDPGVGFHIVERRIKRFEDRIRLYGVDTPERGDPGYNDAKLALADMVFHPSLQPLIVRSVKPHDKYGRWLATIETPTVADVAQAMIDARLGVPYYGGQKQ